MAPDPDFKVTTFFDIEYLRNDTSRVRFAGGVGGFNPPNDFLTPRVSVDLSSWGSILTPVLVLHVSACGASTLLPDGDPAMFFFHKSVTGHEIEPSLL